jgi:crotonobetainyl-CoA:carnitine CoA-transferase CaiB-like acyl-CoA transferase
MFKVGDKVKKITGSNIGRIAIITRAYKANDGDLYVHAQWEKTSQIYCYYARRFELVHSPSLITSRLKKASQHITQ